MGSSPIRPTHAQIQPGSRPTVPHTAATAEDLGPMTRSRAQTRTPPPPRPPSAPPAYGDLSSLLEDWRRHLRAANKAPATIASYLRVGDSFLAYLREHGMPTEATALTREHVEAF